MTYQRPEIPAIPGERKKSSPTTQRGIRTQTFRMGKDAHRFNGPTNSDFDSIFGIVAE